MAYANKSAENKRVAEKCLELKAYNAGVSRAYYSAFLHIKAYLKAKGFDYDGFLRQKGLMEKEYSHGTLQAATVTCLMANGKTPVDVYKLLVIDSLYDKRRRADYGFENIVEDEMKTSLADLDVVISTVA